MKRAEFARQAAEWRMIAMRDDTGYIPPDGLLRAKADADRMRAAFRARAAAAQQSGVTDPSLRDALTAGISRGAWTWIGPGNIGGRVRAIAIDPANPSHLFAGGVDGGIWVTTNAGGTWSVVNDFMTNLAVTSIVYNPATPATMYAATGEGFYPGDAIRGNGIFKSTDSGVTWTQLSATTSSNFYYVNRLAISPDGSTILAATGAGIFQSTNAGSAWTNTLSPTTGGSTDILDVKFLTGSNTSAVASGFNNHIYYSTNGGASWTASASLAPVTGWLQHRIEIGVGGASAPLTVYLSVDNATSSSGQVWKSIDGGVTYTQVGHPATPHLGGQGWYDNAIWIDPTDANYVVVGGLDLWRTADGGTTWTKISTWYYAPDSAHADHHAIVADPGYNGTTNLKVYFGNDGGVYRADNVRTVTSASGGGFTALNNNLGITQFYGAGGNPTSGKIIGGTQDNGTLVYPGTGTTWTTMDGGDGGFSAADPADANYLYGEYVYLTIYRSADGGQAYTDVDIYGMDSTHVCKPAPYSIDDACNSNANFIAPFVMDPNTPATLLAGGKQLWRTDDAKTAVVNTVGGGPPPSGPSWRAIKAATSSSSYISAIAIAKLNSNIAWVGHNNGELYLTTNAAAGTPSVPAYATWTRIGQATLPVRAVTRIVISPTDNNTVYVTYGGFSTGGNVWKTIDGGTTWNSIGTTLPAAPVRAFAVNPTNPLWVYAGTEVGVFASTDGGATWNPTQEGPANVSINDLFWLGSKLVAVTHGRGMFTYDTACQVTLLPSSATIVSSGGTGSIGVTSSCSWTATSNNPFITVTAGSSGTGNGTVSYSVPANATSAPRTGSIAIGGQSFTVSQNAPLMVNPTSLLFAATKNGAAGDLIAVTPPQAVSVSFDAGSAAWTVTPGQSWVSVTPTSGTGSGRFTVSMVNPGNILGASQNISTSVTVTSASLGVTVSVPIQFVIQLAGGVGAVPVGSFDTPANNSTGITGAIAVTGWALDDVGVSRVMLWRNCVEAIDRPLGACTAPAPGQPANFVYIGDGAFLSGARPDVEAVAPTYPQPYRAGWGYLMLTNALPHLTNLTPQGGQGAFTLYAYAIDMEGQYGLLGTKTITLDNDHATIPFGAIDTPTQGGTMTVPIYANFGWAMTQTPKCIDTTTTASFKVYIDGVSRTLTPGSGPAANWFPGLTRSDIAAAYPGLCNTTNALAAYYIDAPALSLSNGLHTIGWDAIDDAGKVAGIGSRFFNVLIGSSAAKADPANDQPVALGSVSDLDWFGPSWQPVDVRVGSSDAPFLPVETDASGTLAVRVPAGGRMALNLGGPVDAGYQIVGGELRELPAGSALDGAAGTFAWQPPVPFLGAFHLVFTTGGDRLDVIATIVDPTADGGVTMHIDSPEGDRDVRSAGLSGPRPDGGPERAALRTGSDDVTGPFVVAGWAFDPLATTGSGIDTLHVWAYRRDVADVAPQFLGAAGVGGLRPDIASTFGAQFAASGFTLSVDGLAPGTYDVFVYPWARRTARFEPAQSVRIVVQ